MSADLNVTYRVNNIATRTLVKAYNCKIYKIY